MTDLSGTPIRMPPVEGTPGDIITLGLMAVTSLGYQGQGEHVDAMEKVKRGLLAERVFLSMQAGEEMSLSSEEVTLLKQQIAKVYGAIPVMKAYRILDPASVK